MRRIPRYAYLLFFCVLCICGTANACTPVATVAFLWCGTAAGYGVLFVPDHARFPIGIVVLLGTILLKALMYARYAGYGKMRAVFDMLGGNVISSIAGIFIGIFVGAVPLLVIPTVCVVSGILGVVAARTIPEGSRRMRPGDLTAVASFALLISVFLLAFAENSDPTLSKTAALGYFALKMAGIYLTFLASVIISAVLEADVIFSLHRKNISFSRETALIAVFKANLYVLLLISVVGALIALPYRLSSPNFLWIRELTR